jgi:Flp pilus assembly protein TadG
VADEVEMICNLTTMRRVMTRRRRGSEVLEAALVFPLLLAMAFGTIEFGYYFYLEHNFQAAAREGARAGVPAGLSASQRADDILAAVDSIMSSAGLKAADYDVDIQYPVVNGSTYVQVSVKADWSKVGMETGLFVRFTGGGETNLVDSGTKIVGTVTMRVEN